jgi:hypothetical protein
MADLKNIPIRSSPKKTIIAVVVASVLGILGGWFGKDLSGLQEPAEQAVGVGVDVAEKAVKDAQRK